MHIRRVGHLAGMLEKNGVCVVVSLISPYESSRRFARSLCGDFVEVHVSTPLEVCEKRDRKGHYAAARRGEKDEDDDDDEGAGHETTHDEGETR